MASINYGAKEISVKVVYYGPGLSGKTTNLQVIHQKVPKEHKSNMVSLATEQDRTLFFDFLPLDLGKIKGFSTKFQLYTVPGQVYYNATRKLVLRGVDGIVFVADSAPDKMVENEESLQNLMDNLAEYGYSRDNIPIILQYNKRDLPNALPIESLQQLNKYSFQTTEAVAIKGKGVFETLKVIGKIVIDELNKKYSRPSGAAQRRPASPMPRPSGPQVPPTARPAQQQAPVRPPSMPPQQQPPPPQRRQNDQFASPPPPPQQQPQRPPDPFAPPPQPQQSSSTQYHIPAIGPQGPALPPQNKPDTSDPFLGNAPAAPQQSSAVGDHNAISLEPLNHESQPLPPSTSNPPTFEVSTSGMSPFDDSKSELDLEIEKYQKEIERKDPAPSSAPTFEVNTPSNGHPVMPELQPTQPPPTQQYSPPAPPPPTNDLPTFDASAPQQNREAPHHAQQPSYQQPEPQNYPSYDAPQANMPPPSPYDSQQHQMPGDNPHSQQPAQGSNSPMYFTSVNTDRSRKRPKKIVNPRDKTNKGLFSKIFRKKDVNE
ncbi:MAG: hypothetical protein GF398_16210 [Chitinivibrionales bacterium]|nr:hypothetical protein [Chitinivibrionales bacterium]